MNVFFIHNIDPVAFSIGSLQIRYYGICFSLTALTTFLITRHLFKRKGYPLENVEPLITTLTLSSIVCARLAHVFFYQSNYFWQNPWKILKIWEGGIASHGVVPGIILGLFIYSKLPVAKQAKMSILQIMDTLIPLSMTGGLIRLGNFFNAEIVGRITDMGWAIQYAWPRYLLPSELTEHYREMLRNDQTFQNFFISFHSTMNPNFSPEKLLNLINSNIDPELFNHLLSISPRHPSQFYEIIYCILTFVISRSLFHNKKIPAGVPIFMAMALFFTGRFCIEFYKEFQTLSPKDFSLTMGQWLSLPYIFLGLAVASFLLLRNHFNRYHPFTKKHTT